MNHPDVLQRGHSKVPRGAVDESIAVLNHTFPVAELDLTPKP